MAQNIVEAFNIARGGYALNDASKQLEEIVRAVMETGKSGEICLVLKVTPDKNDPRIVTLDPDVKTKIPRKKYASGHAFITTDYKLSKEDPQQLELLAERREQGISSIGASEARLEQIGRGGS
jgi:hypothetical protein